MKQILVIFLIALCLRVIFIFNNSISFHYDMARDAFIAREIWQYHDLKIIGPPTSINGLYHGVLYYYVIAPFYMIGGGNPQVPALTLSLINCLTLIPIYLLSIKIFKGRWWALLSCLIFAVSFEATQYGPWLSNPGPALPFTVLFFLGLEMWREKRLIGLPLAVLSASIATQFQFFFLYLFVLIPIYGYLFNSKYTKRNLFISFIFALIGLGTFMVSIIKFGEIAQVFKTLTSTLVGSPTLSVNLFTNMVENYINHFANLFTNTIFPINVFIGGIICLLTFYSCRKNKLIMFMLFSSLPMFIYGGHGSNYANLGILVPAIIAFTFIVKAIYDSKKSLAFAFILLVICVNLYSIAKILPLGQISLVIPTDMLLSRQLKIIDKTYQIADGKPFSISSLTLPLWTNTTWSYLYSWYGQNKYGYVPAFYGRDQAGMPGGDVLVQTNHPLPLSFFIMEPPNGIPPYLYAQEIDTENNKTNLVAEYKYDDITLQNRIPQN